MKKLNIKICAFLLLGIMGTFMAGCSNSKENTKATSNSNKVSESSSKAHSPGNINSANAEKETSNSSIDKKTENQPVQAAANKNADIKEDKEKAIKLTDAEHKKLNIFFSNFSETYVKAFDKGKISDSELINFGFHHNNINNYKRIKGENINGTTYFVLSKEYVFESINKYFGIDISNHKLENGQKITGTYLKYSNGKFYMPAASGETYPFSQLTKLIDNGDGTMTAYVDVYHGNEFEFCTYEPYSKWSENDKKSADKSESYKALIKKESGRYILLEYKKM